MRCEHRRIRNSVDSVPDRKVGQSHRSMRVTLHEARTKEQTVGAQGSGKRTREQDKGQLFQAEHSEICGLKFSYITSLKRKS